MVTKASIFEHVIEPQRGNLSRELAEYILSWNFSPGDHERYEALADKAQEGALTPDEHTEIEDFLAIDSFLAILQAKARVSLGQG